jgi:hypothetical protein
MGHLSQNRGVVGAVGAALQVSQRMGGFTIDIFFQLIYIQKQNPSP